MIKSVCRLHLLYIGSTSDAETDDYGYYWPSPPLPVPNVNFNFSDQVFPSSTCTLPVPITGSVQGQIDVIRTELCRKEP